MLGYLVILNVSVNLSLCVSPVIDWPIQGIPCLLTYDSWDRLQTHSNLEVDKKMD